MNAIGDRQPTSPHGLLRRAQKEMDAGMQRLIEDATASGAQLHPEKAPPKAGSTIHVVA